MSCSVYPSGHTSFLDNINALSLVLKTFINKNTREIVSKTGE